MAGLSFMHRCEVEMRNEIGLETLSFGRDYPHTEATWPNTREYLRALFEGVSVEDLRLIMGENLARFLELDHQHLSDVAERIGYSPADILEGDVTMDSPLQAHLDMRCGYSKPPEGEKRFLEVEPLMQQDLVSIGAA
jgi:hypothetical protein